MSVVLEYKFKGNCTIDIDGVFHEWNENFGIRYYHSKYELIEYTDMERDLQSVVFRVSISEEQGKELIEKLKLKPVSEKFNSAKIYVKKDV